MNELRYEQHQTRYAGQDMMEFLANTTFADLPADVVKRGVFIVMDAIACMLAGRKTRDLYGTHMDFFADDTAGHVKPVGCDMQTSGAMAAFLNALHCQTHDFNDGLNNSGMLGGAYHPGRVVVSVALAVGQQIHASGADVLLAVVLGIESAARLRNIAHDSTVADSYGAATAAAKLMGANEKQIRAVLALTANFVPGRVSKSAGLSGSAGDGKTAGPTVNPLNYAFICRHAVEMAQLVMNGFDGPGINNDGALSPCYYTTGLGKEYMCMDMYFKPWPCCRKTHGAIDAALSLRNEHGVKAEDVKAIRIFQQTRGMYVNIPVTDKLDICFGGQFSLQYVVSCVFLDGCVELKHFRWPDRKAPQKYVDFAGKITVCADSSLDGHNAISPNHAIVEVEKNDGTVLSMYCSHPLGSEPNGMTDEQFIQKLRSCADNLSEGEKDSLVDWILNLPALKEI